MFPDAKNTPASFSERSRYHLVAAFVSSDFVEPVLAIACWYSTVTATAVPEAAIHEYDDATKAKNEVWLPW